MSPFWCHRNNISVKDPHSNRQTWRWQCNGMGPTPKVVKVSKFVPNVLITLVRLFVLDLKHIEDFGFQPLTFYIPHDDSEYFIIDDDSASLNKNC